MTKKLANILDKFLWICGIMMILILSSSYFFILNFFEQDKHYGLNPIYLFFGLKKANIIISSLFLGFCTLLLMKFSLILIEKYTNISRLKNTVLISTIYLLIILILGFIHALNYFTNSNAHYSINEEIVLIERRTDSLRYQKAIDVNLKNLDLIDEISTTVEKADSFTYTVKQTSRSRSKREIRNNGYKRFDFETGNSNLKIYFRTFDINRSIRFDIFKGENYSFFWTLPYDSTNIKLSNNTDDFLLKKSFIFYDSLQNDKFDYKVEKEHLLNVIALLKLDHNLTIDIIKKNFEDSKKYKVGWDVFIYDTFFKALHYDQEYIKGFDFFSRNLVLIQALLLLTPLSGVIILLNKFLKQRM